MLNWIKAVVLTAALISFSTFAIADDWIAKQLRGPVMELVDGQWVKLNRGDVVPDSRVVQTLAAGHVTFVRGEETVELGPHTQIQIVDKPTNGKPFTTVKQSFGMVSVEAQVQNVQHFAVDTPYLAAVVKGTRFTVTSGDKGASVTVRRGHVAVTGKQNKQQVLISVGQTASVGANAGDPLVVSGSGKLPKVLDAKGNPVAEVSTGGLFGGSTGEDLVIGGTEAGGSLVAVTGDDGLGVTVGGSGSGSSLASATVGGSSVASVTVGSSGSGSSVVSATVGGSSLVNVGVLDSGGDGSDSGGTGQLLNLQLGGLHLGL
jgi:FecR-like protein